MTAATQQAVENLYTVFSRYPLNPNMRASALYSEQEVAKWYTEISSKPMRDLTGDELAFFAFKVCYTWGDTSDYKHFLPRLLELIALYQGESMEEWLVFKKLAYCHWREWDKTEQDAVLQYLDAFWQQLLHEDEEVVILFEVHFDSIAKVHPSFSWMLEKWQEATTSASFSKFCTLIEDNERRLTRRREINAFEDYPELKKAFITWAKNQMQLKLKNAFETLTNEELLEKIIHTVEILDDIPDDATTPTSTPA